MRNKFVSEWMVAVLAGLGVAFPGMMMAADASRDLTWTFAGEAFEDPANWTWTAESSESILTGPGAADRVLFGGTAVDKTIRFNADAVVSNFICEATAVGTTLFDLATHTLTVSNNMSIKCADTLKDGDGNPLPVPLLVFQDGTIRVTGTARGTTEWGQPNEDAGGFFLNRAYQNLVGINLRFERVALEVASSPKTPSMRLQHGYGKTSRVHLTDGTTWNLPAFNLVNDETKPVEMLIEGSVFKTTGDVVSEGEGPGRWLFTAGAALEAACVRSHMRENPGLSFIFDGGSHALGSSAYAGDIGSCSLAWTDVVVSNSAVLAAQDVLSIRSASTITVCEGGSLSTLKTAKVGHHAWQEAAQFGDCALVLNNGTASFGALEVGSREQFSNNCVRVTGPASRMEVTGEVALNYGTTVALEIPVEGWRDADGAARAPVYAQGGFTTKTVETCRPISLELTTKAFDLAHPQGSVTLLQAGSAVGGDVFAALQEQTVWVDNPDNHGELSVSADGCALIYTAPARRGLIISIQ